MGKKKVKEESRRLSVKERSRNESDVRSWVVRTQPSRRAQPDYQPPEELDDSTESEPELMEEPVRLDGGYAWVIVLFSFCLHFIADGLTFSFGTMFNDIVMKFEVSRLTAGFIASLFLSGPLSLSPFAGIIGDHLGSKIQLIAGLTLAAIGIVLAAGGLHVHILGFFFIGFSLFLAIGLALIYNGAIVIINLYFNERKSGLATSLAVSGTGVGTITFPLFHILFDYLFPNNAAMCILIFSLVSILLALICCIFFIHDVEWTSDGLEYKEKLFEKFTKRLEKEKENDDYELDEDHTVRRCVSLPNASNFNELRGSIIDLGISMKSVRETVSMTKQMEPPVPRSRSVGAFMKRNLVDVPEYSMLNAEDFGHLDHLDLHMGHSPCNTVHSQRRRMLSKTSMSLDALQDQDELSENKKCFSDSEDEEETEIESDSALSNDGESSESELSDKVLNKEEKSTADPLQSLKMDSTRVIRPSVAVNQAPGRVLVGRTAYRVVTNTNMLGQQLKVPSAPLVCPRKKRWHERNLLIRNTITALKQLPGQFPIYWNAVKQDPALQQFCLSVSLLYLVLDVPYITFFDHAVESLGLSKTQGSLLTSCIGCFSLCSTIVIGLCSHNKKFKEMMFYFNGLAMIFLGIATFFAGLVVEFHWILVVCAVLGTFLSSNYVLQSVMLAQLYQDPSKFCKIYAFVSMCQGGASCVGPILIGWIRDLTGHYVMVYYVSAVVLFISGFCSIRTGYLDKKGHRGSYYNDGSPTSQRSPAKSVKNGDIPLLEIPDNDIIPV